MVSSDRIPLWLTLPGHNIDSHEEFVRHVLRSVLASYDAFDDDNIDASYPADGFGEQSASLEKRLTYFRFFHHKSARLFGTYAHLADAPSRQLFVALVLFRILGYRRVVLPVDHIAYFAARDETTAIPRSHSVLPCYLHPAGAKLEHFEFLHSGHVIRLDCLEANLFFTFLMRQYHLIRDAVNIAPRKGDVVIDAGACFGDTAVDFAMAVGPDGHVYSFEVLQSHLDIVSLNVQQNNLTSAVTLLPYALGKHDSEGKTPSGPADPGFRAPRSSPVRSLDSLVLDGTIKRVDFIKMDIEGGELAALEGAAYALKRFRPRLAISIYHNVKDYYQIPECIQRLSLGYRMYLANHTVSDGETVLYCTCEDCQTGAFPQLN